MNETEKRSSMMGALALATDYCATLENAREMERDEFVAHLTVVLPRLYALFAEVSGAEDESDEESMDAFGPYINSHMDEQYYDSIRRNAEALLGPDDTFLETFEEDMKYSDTPIGASVSEGLADIFQDLYNFVSEVKESDGEALERAFVATRENFVQYWSQTLCNVMRPLNHIRFSAY